MHRLRPIAFAALLLLAAAAARAEGFVTGIEDLPLAPGLAEVENSGTVFDTAAGRIVEVFAVGQVAPEDVARFYRDALPQLGWEATGSLAFEREGEKLSIALQQNGPDLTVRFSLTPE
jgi:hypothetical protein